MTDVRVRLLSYYISHWMKLCDVSDKNCLQQIDEYLSRHTPTLEDISIHPIHKSILYILNKYKADIDDYMGQTDLHDVLLSLKQLCNC